MANNKRSRDDEPDKLPAAKRFWGADIILDILSDDDDVDAGDVADVVRSLEEEISAPAPATEGVNGPSLSDFQYLLEASDDELGIPPAAETATSSAADDRGVVVEVSDDEPEVPGFDRIWGFEDDVALINPYEWLSSEIPAEFDDGVGFDGALFNYFDEASDHVVGASTGLPNGGADGGLQMLT